MTPETQPIVYQAVESEEDIHLIPTGDLHETRTTIGFPYLVTKIDMNNKSITVTPDIGSLTEENKTKAKAIKND